MLIGKFGKIKLLRVLVACEYSGVVRDSFSKLGHDAWSCDLLPTEAVGNHIQGNVLNYLNDGWDLMIGHPPCTHLAVSGAPSFYRKKELQEEALEFFLTLGKAPIKRICLENPVSIISTRLFKPDQIIHPWQFGHADEKTTCLWLKNLPLLMPTKIIKGKHRNSLHELFLTVSDKRLLSHLRSKTFQGIADAMANQWGCLKENEQLGLFF